VLAEQRERNGAAACGLSPGFTYTELMMNEWISWQVSLGTLAENNSRLSIQVII